MKNNGPIPIPPAQRWHEFRLRVLPAVVFAVSSVVIAYLWSNHVSVPSMVGQAEAQLAAVSSHKPGVLANLTVSRFQSVKAGDTIAQVIVADPRVVESSLAVIRADLDMLRANMQPIVAQQRNAVDYAQLRLDWMRQRADLAATKVNLQLAEAEFHRSEELFKTKLISQSEYDTATANYNALQEQAAELTKLVSEGETNFSAMKPDAAQDITHISNEPMRAAIAVQEAKLRLTEAELNPVVLKAPIDGVVTMIHHCSGEAIIAGQPVVSIASSEPTRVVGYLRLPLASAPVAGDEVQIRTRGPHRHSATAQVLAVGAQLEPVPAIVNGLTKLDIAQQGLPINISLPRSLALRPGELVDVSMVSQAD